MSVFNEYDGRFASAMKISLRDPEANLMEENRLLKLQLQISEIDRAAAEAECDQLRAAMRRRVPSRSREERALRLAKAIAVGLAPALLFALFVLAVDHA
jgi:hypothetical protein